MLNGRYSEVNTIDAEYWRSLEVPYDHIKEITLEQQIAIIGLPNRKKEELTELREVLGKSIEKNTTDEEIINSLIKLSPDTLEKLCLLVEFQLRRVRSIQTYYSGFSTVDEKRMKSPLAQLLQMLDDAPKHLIHIYTQHLWDIKASGEKWVSDKCFTLEKVKKLISESGYRNTYINQLYNASGQNNNYKVYAYHIVKSDSVLILLHKQVRDISRADYDHPVRNKEVKDLLIGITPSLNEVEFKHLTKTECQIIVEYLETTLNCSMTKVQPTIYDDYKPEQVLNVLSGAQNSDKAEINEDFRVESVTFRTSLLRNSPDMTLKTESIDVWETVRHAYEKECISLRSIKDLKSMTFFSSEINRTIRSQVLSNGNVVLTYDDRSVNAQKKKQIDQQFLKRFGFPLFLQIANEKFPDGKADKIDFAMSKQDKDGSVPKEMYQELISHSLIDEKKHWVATCKNESCGHQFIRNSYDESPCPDCLFTVIIQEVALYPINLNTITKYVSTELQIVAEKNKWKLRNDTQLTVDGEQFSFVTFQQSDGQLLKVLVTRQPFRKAVINRIHKIMTPTVLVFCGVGASTLDSYQEDCIQAVSFGEFYTKNQAELADMFQGLYEAISLREKHYIGRAANKAYETLLDLTKHPEKFSKSYSSQFEDDVYAILKNIFPNATKWGREASGKKVPEGVFTIGYRTFKPDTLDHKNVFSYDCKYSENDKGYALQVDEQRKAFEYVGTLNRSDFVSKFASLKQLSGHIFISNKFRHTDYVAMKAYFEEEYGKDPSRKTVGTPPIFMDVSTLVHLYKSVQENWNKIIKAQHIFYEKMSTVFQPSLGSIRQDDIDEAIELATDIALIEIQTLDMNKLKKEIIK